VLLEEAVEDLVEATFGLFVNKAVPIHPLGFVNKSFDQRLRVLNFVPEHLEDHGCYFSWCEQIVTVFVYGELLPCLSV